MGSESSPKRPHLENDGASPNVDINLQYQEAIGQLQSRIQNLEGQLEYFGDGLNQLGVEFQEWPEGDPNFQHENVEAQIRDLCDQFHQKLAQGWLDTQMQMGELKDNLSSNFRDETEKLKDEVIRAFSDVTASQLESLTSVGTKVEALMVAQEKVFQTKMETIAQEIQGKSETKAKSLIGGVETKCDELFESMHRFWRDIVRLSNELNDVKQMIFSNPSTSFLLSRLFSLVSQPHRKPSAPNSNPTVESIHFQEFQGDVKRAFDNMMGRMARCESQVREISQFLQVSLPSQIANVRSEQQLHSS